MVQNLHLDLVDDSDLASHSDLRGYSHLEGSFRGIIQISSGQCQLTLTHHIHIPTAAGPVVEVKCLSASVIKTILCESKVPKLSLADRNLLILNGVR